MGCGDEIGEVGEMIVVRWGGAAGCEIRHGNETADVEQCVGRALARVVGDLICRAPIRLGVGGSGRVGIVGVVVHAPIGDDSFTWSAVNNDRAGFVAVDDHVSSLSFSLG